MFFHFRGYFLSSLVTGDVLPLSPDREFETESLSHVNGYAKLGKTFLSVNQALIGFNGC